MLHLATPAEAPPGSRPASQVAAPLSGRAVCADACDSDSDIVPQGNGALPGGLRSSSCCLVYLHLSSYCSSCCALICAATPATPAAPERLVCGRPLPLRMAAPETVGREPGTPSIAPFPLLSAAAATTPAAAAAAATSANNSSSPSGATAAKSCPPAAWPAPVPAAPTAALPIPADVPSPPPPATAAAAAAFEPAPTAPLDPLRIKLRSSVLGTSQHPGTSTLTSRGRALTTLATQWPVRSGLPDRHKVRRLVRDVMWRRVSPVRLTWPRSRWVKVWARGASARMPEITPWN